MAYIDMANIVMAYAIQTLKRVVECAQDGVVSRQSVTYLPHAVR